MKKLLPILLLLSTFGLQAQTAISSIDSAHTRLDKIDKALKILREFRVLVYLQPQFQLADTAGAKSYAGGDFPALSNNRITIRRGRFKLMFDHEGKKGFRVFQSTFQIDVTERGFQLRDFYGRIIDPWTGWFGLQMGVMDRPFGYELTTIDDMRESPERGRMSQIIMPAEKDLGAALVIESPKTFKPVYLRLDAGAFNGTGSAVSSFTARKDFIGRLQARKIFTLNKTSTFTLSGGASYYHGSVLQQSPFVFDMEKNPDGLMKYTRVTDSAAADKKFYKRQYYGVELQASADYKLGTTTLRGEFIAGQQPGASTTDLVPTAITSPVTDLTIRHFRGAYAYLVQTFKQNLKGGHTIYHDLVFKYDWYDPNTQLAPKNMNSSTDTHLSLADVPFHTLGVGYIFRPYEFFQLQVYYDMVKNPTTHITGYTRDVRDNVLTIRAQFRFDTKWFSK